MNLLSCEKYFIVIGRSVKHDLCSSLSSMKRKRILYKFGHQPQMCSQAGWGGGGEEGFIKRKV